MGHRFTVLLGGITIGAWLSMSYVLLPTPAHQFMPPDDVLGKSAGQVLADEAKELGMSITELARITKADRERKETAAWVKWILLLSGIALGVCGGASVIIRWKYGLYLVWLASLLYIFGWLAGIDSLRGPVSLTFLDALTFYVVSTLRAGDGLSIAGFIHRDVLLLTFHLVLITFIPYWFIAKDKGLP